MTNGKKNAMLKYKTSVHMTFGHGMMVPDDDLLFAV